MSVAGSINPDIVKANYHAEYMRKVRDAGKEIGRPHEPQNVERVEACRGSLKLYCETYYPEAFKLAWSPDHLRIITKLENTIINGGLYAIAMPRGSGKTTIVVRAAEWAILYGHRRFVCIVAATQKGAEKLLKAVKTNLTYNPDLLTDFPLAVYPIQCLQDEPKRCSGQTIDGEPTSSRWLVDEVVMPTVNGSMSSGSVITARGLTGDIRGQQHTTPSGEILRPDYALIDDPQTRQSAGSSSQTRDRLETINGDIMGLGGPGVKMAGVIACTKINAGDLADSVLDREIAPEWSGECTKMVYKFPENVELWDEYRGLRTQEFIEGETEHKKSTAFYKTNRKAMDKGSEVSWPERKNPDELSAIQHAMNLRFRNESAFMAEYQNDPDGGEALAGEFIDRKGLERIIGPLPRYVVPAWAQKVTAFIDIQGKILWYMVVAWGDSFRGAVIDYGAYPDQRQLNFTKRSARYSYHDGMDEAGPEAALFKALKTVVDNLMGFDWKIEGSEAKAKIDTLMIDVNWPNSTDTAYRVISESEYRGSLRGSRGNGYKAKSGGSVMAPVQYWKKKPGDIKKWHLVDRMRETRLNREVIYQTDPYKTTVMNRIKTPDGGAGTLQLYKDKAHRHEMVLDHFCSERSVPDEIRGQGVNVFGEVGGQDNDLWDCLVGCAAGAVLSGVDVPGVEAKPAGRRKRRRGHAKKL